MCTLALFLQQSPRLPLLVAANRDEYLARPASEPAVIERDPWIVAGRDLVAGGTWLGLNQHGLVVGILNRRTSLPVDPDRLSRGSLCIDALRCASLAEARALVEPQRGDSYNPFNLLIASSSGALVVQNHDATMAVTELPPGLHLLTNLDLNDATCPRIAKSHALFDAARSRLADDDPSALLEHLRSVLSDHSTPLDPRGSGPIENLCVHLGPYGTRSSSVLMIPAAGSPRYFHAAGAPCENAYREIALPRL